MSAARRTMPLAVLLSIPLLLLPRSLPAGTIEPHFREAILRLPPEADVQAIVMLADQADLVSLQASLEVERATRQVWHERVVRTLQATAQATQGPVMTFLKERQARGAVREYRGYWIANCVAVTARPAVLLDLAERFDVGTIYPDERVHLIEPVQRKSGLPALAGVEPGLRAINADDLWYQGITGLGRLVCNLDTGVDGNHPALANRWRGLQPGVTPEEAWFDPVTGTQFPFDGNGHGTHTMGTMTGRNSASGDTVGVAPDARWIAAGVIDRVDIPTTIRDAIAAFEWVADPDGDPGTVDDVPDVASNSWGLSPLYHGVPPCDETFWVAIDGAEAATVVVVFAAGNEGPSSETLRTPADRITTSVNAFSVGALNTDNTTIASFSSRGPSGCDGVTKKPEVCAQGVNVRSSLPGGGYGSLSGTSMACPHVAGAVALLRQVSPNATVEQIKLALLTTATDLGPGGEDNSYGRGRINVLAAASALGTFGSVQGHVTDLDTGDPLAANIRVLGTAIATQADGSGFYRLTLAADTTYTLEASFFGHIAASAAVAIPANGTVTQDFALEPMPTGTLQGTVTDKDGSPIAGATVSLPGTPIASRTTNGAGFYQFAAIPGGLTYEVLVTAIGYSPETQSTVVPAGGTATLDFILLAGFFDNMEQGNLGWTHTNVTPGYADQWHLSTQRNHTPGGSTSWKCGDTGSGSYADLLDAGLVSPTVALTGHSRLTFWQWIDAEILDANEAWDGGIVEVSLNNGPFTQITPVGGYPYTIVDNPASPFEPGTPCYSGYVNWGQAEFDLTGIVGTARFRFRFGSDGYVTEEGWYIDDVSLLSAPAVTVDLIPPADTDIPRGGTLVFDVQVRNNTILPQTVRGRLEAISQGGRVFPIAGPRTVTLAGSEVRTFDDVSVEIPSEAPLVMVTMKGVLENLGGTLIDSDSFLFTITAGVGSQPLAMARRGAPAMVPEGDSWVAGLLVSGWLEGGESSLQGERPSLPRSFALSPNFPNPFNPSTLIRFDVPEREGEPAHILLRIYSLRGEVVRTLVDETLPAGSHQVHWDGLDGQRRPVASGVYIYRLEGGGFSAQRKMVLAR